MPAGEAAACRFSARGEEPLCGNGRKSLLSFRIGNLKSRRTGRRRPAVTRGAKQADPYRTQVARNRTSGPHTCPASDAEGGEGRRGASFANESAASPAGRIAAGYTNAI